MDLGSLTEDDVVEAFKSGLRAFLRREGGSLGARRVTLRQENVFPSDQDFALRLDRPGGFRVHMFGLQFKKWNRDGWVLAMEQVDCLRPIGHGIAYCFPRPGYLSTDNTLHGFYFVNPRRVAPGSSRLALFRPGELLTLGVTSDDLGKDVQRRLDFRLRLSDFIRERSILSPTSADEVRSLRKLFHAVSEVIREAVTELPPVAKIGAAADWGQTVLSTRGGEGMVMVPYLCWGDFFEAVQVGSTVITVPGDFGNPPDPDEPLPQGNIVPAAGLGLTISCPGAWGSAWASNQIDTHVAKWTRTTLEPPAAIIAYQSFSRAMEFIEYHA